jgi:hypothetical protein
MARETAIQRWPDILRRAAASFEGVSATAELDAGAEGKDIAASIHRLAESINSNDSIQCVTLEVTRMLVD